MLASPSAMLRVGMIRQIWRSIAPQHAVASALGQHLTSLSATAASVLTRIRGGTGCWHRCFSKSHQSVHSHMAEEHAAKRKKLDVAAAAPAELDANEVIIFRLLDPGSNATELTEEASFAPEMCHQFFGDDELIKGYPDLSVDIWLDQRTYVSYADTRYSSSQTGATDIHKALSANFPEGLETSKAEFLAKVAAVEKPSLESLGPILSLTDFPDGSSLAVYHVNLATAHESIKALHARMQPLLLFFIDGANLIDSKEPEWDMLLAVHTKGDIVTVRGFCTVYSFFCYPDRSRLRVSQVLVLPPFQRQGVGRGLLQAVYALADTRNALDVTYEDATDNIQSIREKLELERAAKLEWLRSAAAARAHSFSSAANGHAQVNGHGGREDSKGIALSLPLTQRAQRELRVSKQQVRKLWEALLASQTEMQAGEGAARLEALVQARLVGNVTSTKRVAEDKRVYELEGGFIMTKCPASSRVGAAAGMPPALETEDASGQSAEEREAALAESVQTRMEELRRLAAFVQRIR